jgi:GT2 family glycosyltransferase
MQLAVERASHVSESRNRPLLASIIIVNYNAREKLRECLESVVRAGYANCEIIVVDNASSDGMADAVEIDFPSIKLIRSETNVGFGAANNLAARKAEAKYLVFLNPDTIVQSGWLEALLTPFCGDDRAGLVTSCILLADNPELINTCGTDVHFTGLTLCRGLREPRDSYGKREEIDAVSGAAFAIRYEIFEALEGFDEDTFLYMEDTDLSWRSRLAGWRCLYEPNSVVLHHYALKITPLKVFYQERNRYLMLAKTLKWPTLVVLLPSQIMAEIITWGFVLYSDRANIMNKLRAYAWIISNWQLVLRKRRATQLHRRVPDRVLLEHTKSRLKFETATGGAVATLADFVFNPFFFILKKLAMWLIWW